MSYSHKQETGRPVKIKDEGLTLVNNVASIDFTGAGVSGSVIGDDATEEISGGGDTIAPATNTADHLPQWNGADSKTLKDGLAVPAGGLAGITALNLKAPLASPAFTGTVSGITAAMVKTISFTYFT